MAFVRNPVVYVPDLTNGRPIVDGKVYLLTAGTVPPTQDSAINPADLLTVTYVNEAGNTVTQPQPLYTSKGGCLYGSFPEEARQYMIAPQEYVFAAYDKIGRLQYSADTTASDYVETDALAAVDSTVLVGGVQARQIRLIDGIKNLIAEPNITMSVKGFYVGSSVGGGDFYYDPSLSKASHNGGTIIAPEALDSWDGTVGSISTLLNWYGSGYGCFVRIDAEEIEPEFFGAINDGVTNSSQSVLASFKCAEMSNKAVKINNQSKFLLNVPIPLYNGMSIKGFRGSERDATQRSVIKNSTTEMFSISSNIFDISFLGVTFIGGSANHFFTPQNKSTGFILFYSQIEKCGFEAFVSHYSGRWTAVNWRENWQGGSRGPSLDLAGADSKIEGNFIDTPHLVQGQYVCDIQSMSKTTFINNFVTGQQGSTPLRWRGNRAGSGSRGNVIAFNEFDSSSVTQIDGACVYLQEVDGMVMMGNYYHRFLGSPFSFFSGAITVADSANVGIQFETFDLPLTDTAAMSLVRVIQTFATVDGIYVGKLNRVNCTLINNVTSSGSVTFEKVDFFQRLFFRMADATDAIIQSSVSGDTVNRIQLRADGRIDWGPGNAAQDVNLFRHSAGTLRVSGAFRVGLYTVATLPSPSLTGISSLIFVTDESGGAVHAFSDGVNWRRVTDRAIVS